MTKPLLVLFLQVVRYRLSTFLVAMLMIMRLPLLILERQIPPLSSSEILRAILSSGKIATQPPRVVLANVYRCTRKRDSGTDEVAVKAPRFANLSESESAKVDKSINREIEIWYGLKHEYVLPFHGTVEGFGRFRALVFPWMPNGNLNSYLNRTDVSLTAMDKFILLRRITVGLKYLHDNNVIHGDLTSNNVLIAADGSPRLVDFGISNIIRQSDNMFSYHPGAARWVAPECMVLQEEEATQCGTKSADIYALGCIILEVLYEELPYWWIKHAMHVITAKFKNMKPFNSSIYIESNHLDFMQRCWSDESKTRPSVDDVLAFLDGLSSLSIVSSSYSTDAFQARLKSSPKNNVFIPRDLTKCISKTGEHPIAKGGFGDVWKCVYQNGQGQTNVAVKSVRVYTSDTAGEEKISKRLQRELKISAAVQHPNIITTYGYTTGFGPHRAIVSRWADNGDLLSYLEREDARLDLVRRFQILRDIVAGLQHLHTHNIIHGDLTGQNVLIHSDGTACLTDFGLSLMYSEGIDQASWISTFNGSAHWLAPELLEQTEDDSPVRPSECSDIYSYGGVMLYVLTGKIPFYWLRRIPVIRCIFNGERPCRSRYDRPVSDDYWHFIETCWSPVPDARPSTNRVFKVIGDELESLSSSNANS